MNNLSTLAGFYYLALATGYYNKSDVIKWADHCIENHGIPYGIIELSLSDQKSIEDTLSILKSLYGKYEFEIPMYMMLGFIRSDFMRRKITEDIFFTYMYSLYTHGCMSDKDVANFSVLDQLSDGYYLATEGIYGKVEDVVQDAVDELMKFEDYKDILKDFLGK